MKFVNPRALILGAVVLVAAIALVFAFDSGSGPKTTDVVAVVRDVQAGKVSQVQVSRDGRDAVVVYRDENQPRMRVNLPAGTTMAQILEQAGVPFADWPAMPVQSESFAARISPVARIAVVVGLLVVVFLVLRRTMGGFGRSGSRKGAFDPVRPGERTVLFSDVAGSEEIKEEVADIVEFLRDPERFYRLGARIPRGVLLVGPPGTGKTLLARAVAGEARASFFSVSGSEFVEMYVGVGASRVRELFKRARECAPAIIFIDEIDAIGRKRGRAEHSSEYDQTLNQILVEMDGFEQRTTVVVLAATNRADILDGALLRPGRFDRKVHVDLPDRAARAAILRVHARGKPLAPDADLDELATRTTGLSGADLANLMNEGAIMAARRGNEVIAMADLLESIDRAMAGPARPPGRFSEREREVVAYHEAGHALVAHFLPHADSVRKVSIVARGRAGGYTMISPDQDRGLWTRNQLTDRLAALLGGYAAEEIIYGDVTTGSSNDLEQVTSITLSMVARYGMGRSFGLFAIGEDSRSSGTSQRTAFAAETEAREIVENARRLAHQVLTQHRADLEQLAERLLEVETVEQHELIELFGRAATAQPRQRLTQVPAQLPPPRAIRPAVTRRRRPSRLERAVALPAAIVSTALVSRRRRTPERGID